MPDQVRFGQQRFGDFRWGQLASGGYTNSLTFEWDATICWMYNRNWVLNSGQMTVDANISNLYVYVDGTLSGLDSRVLEVQTSTEEPEVRDIQATQIFIGDSILTDTDGSITGIRGRKYVRTSYFPLSVDGVETDAADTSSIATIITNTDIISLGYNQTPIYVEVTYTYQYEFQLLGVIESDANEIVTIRGIGLYGGIGDARLNNSNIETFAFEVYIRNSFTMSDRNRELIRQFYHLMKSAHLLGLIFFEAYSGSYEFYGYF